MVALIPAAGLGTRMHAVTGGAPKELLPLGGRSVLGHLVAEAREAGSDRVVVIASPEKQAAFERELAGAEVRIAVQPAMHGLAHALACAGEEGEALVLLGDCPFHGGSPLARMADLVARGIEGAVAVEPIDDAGTRQYGVVKAHPVTGGIQGILEKPGPEATASRWGVAARYALGPRLHAMLHAHVARALNDGRTGEISLTEVLQEAIREGMDLKAVALQPGQERLDCGSPDAYRAAQARFARG